MVKFMTASEAAQKWYISHRRVQRLCADGRIDGAFKLGDNWAIPIDTLKPDDARYKRRRTSNEQ